MSSVLVLGATGSIGYDVALAFLNKGFKVYGTTRTQDKADFLTKQEIIPIVTNVNDFGNWEKIAYSVDVIVEAVADYTDYSTGHNVVKKLKEIGTAKPTIHVIYASGVWIYGPSADNQTFTETSPLDAFELHKQSGRVKKHNEYLTFNSTVIVPGLVYGRGGSLSAEYLRHVASGEYKFPGSNIVQPFVHASDIAQLFVLSALNPGKSRGQVFNAVAYNEKREDIVHALATASKIPVKSITYSPHANLYEECLSKSQRVSGQKAKNILGWSPSQPSLVEGAERYWLAYQQYNKKN